MENKTISPLLTTTLPKSRGWRGVRGDNKDHLQDESTILEVKVEMDREYFHYIRKIKQCLLF